MIVPWREIPADSLQNLIEEFVSRDGTDYGETEIPLEKKTTQIKNALNHGDMLIWFDEETETVSLFTREQLQQLQDAFGGSL